MDDVKWIKITTDMFDNRKIKHLRRLPDGNNVVLIWVMLLTLAGRCNSGGMIFLTENIPYTPKMLADELDFEESTVQLALTVLEQLGMIQTDSAGFLNVSGWAEHQNIEGMDKIRESKRLAQARWRAKQKALQSTVDSTRYLVDDADKDIDKDIERELDNITVSKDTVCSTDVLRIVEAWNSLGLAKVTKIVTGKNRDKLLKARIREYGVEGVLQAIENIRQSDFLTGHNKKGWAATFDWFILPNNFPKVLDGNYSNGSRGGPTKIDYGDPEDFYK